MHRNEGLDLLEFECETAKSLSKDFWDLHLEVESDLQIQAKVNQRNEGRRRINNVALGVVSASPIRWSDAAWIKAEASVGVQRVEKC